MSKLAGLYAIEAVAGRQAKPLSIFARWFSSPEKQAQKVNEAFLRAIERGKSGAALRMIKNDKKLGQLAPATLDRGLRYFIGKGDNKAVELIFDRLNVPPKGWNSSHALGLTDPAPVRPAVVTIETALLAAELGNVTALTAIYKKSSLAERNALTSQSTKDRLLVVALKTGSASLVAALEMLGLCTFEQARAALNEIETTIKTPAKG